MNQSQFSFKFSYLKYRIVTFLSFISLTRRMRSILMSVLAIEAQTCGTCAAGFFQWSHTCTLWKFHTWFSHSNLWRAHCRSKNHFGTKRNIMQVSFKNPWGHTEGLVKIKMPLFYRGFSVLLCALECFWGRLAHFSIFTRLLLLRQRAVHTFESVNQHWNWSRHSLPM